MSPLLLRKWFFIGLLGGMCLLSGCNARPLLPGSTAHSIDGQAGGSYQDNFIPGQSGNWAFEQDEQGSTDIVNEQLVITIATPNTIQYATLTERVFGDFALEVDAWQRSGPLESSFGILFRMQDNQQFYRFDITGNGLYMIERRNSDGTWNRLVSDWVSSPAINQGLNVANRLKIIAAGPNLAFYVNDILLTQLTDNSYLSGTIALDAGTFGGGNLQVSFDNLVIVGEDN